MPAGGNFIDTANKYTNGTSERYVGEFIASERDKFVLATKYSLSTRQGDPNAGGNHRKNMVQSLEASLKRLNTDYIDLYWVHIWDELTPVDEVMRALDDMVRSGKVLYIGISDTPAWVIAQANTLADFRGWSRFVGLQVPYNLVRRDVEQELLPMARAFDMAVAAWAPLAAGVLTGKYNTSTDEQRRYSEDGVSEHDRALAALVMKIADEIGRRPSQVAINWVRQQQRGVIIPIIGARSERQIKENLASLDFTLTPEQLQQLNKASDYQPLFPHSFLGDQQIQSLIHSTTLPLIDRHRH